MEHRRRHSPAHHPTPCIQLFWQAVSWRRSRDDGYTDPCYTHGTPPKPHGGWGPALTPPYDDVAGILTMLYHCARLQQLSPRSVGLLDSTLAALLAIRTPAGNLPTVYGREDEGLVHWCHGAPGMPALIEAALAARTPTPSPPSQQPAAAASPSSLSRETLLDAAIRAGEIVWTRGLLTKGYGLCHGVSGNAYTFLTLYRITNEPGQLARAHAFASMLHDADLAAAISATDDPQRRGPPGVPDSPQSLMEGSAGVACFLLDLARASEGSAAECRAAFPGWEVPV